MHGAIVPSPAKDGEDGHQNTSHEPILLINICPQNIRQAPISINGAPEIKSRLDAKGNIKISERLKGKQTAITSPKGIPKSTKQNDAELIDDGLMKNGQDEVGVTEKLRVGLRHSLRLKKFSWQLVESIISGTPPEFVKDKAYFKKLKRAGLATLGNSSAVFRPESGKDQVDVKDSDAPPINVVTTINKCVSNSDRRALPKHNDSLIIPTKTHEGPSCYGHPEVLEFHVPAVIDDAFVCPVEGCSYSHVEVNELSMHILQEMKGEVNAWWKTKLQQDNPYEPMFASEDTHNHYAMMCSKLNQIFRFWKHVVAFERSAPEFGEPNCFQDDCTGCLLARL